MSLYKTSLLFGIAAVTLLALPKLSLAQAAQGKAVAKSEVSTALRTIIVTAQRRAEPLQSVPVSISVVSENDIRQLNITTANQLSQLVPNLSIAKGSSGIGGNTAFIRGIGNQEPLLTIDSPVGMYLDGVYLGHQAGINFPLMDLARIEVLRGPQGTLYGRNTTGGAINLITRNPSDKFGMEEKVQFESFNQWMSRTKLNTGTIGDTNLAATVIYQHHGDGGYVRNLDGGMAPGEEVSNALWGKIRGDWSDLTATLESDYTNMTGEPQPWQTTYAYPVAQTYFSQSPRYGGDPFVVSPHMMDPTYLQNVGPQENKTFGVGLTLHYHFSSLLSLKSITAYRSWSMADQPASYAGNLRGPVVDFTSPTLYSVQPVTPFIAPPLHVLGTHQYSQEFQLLGTHKHWNYVAGLYYFQERVHEFNLNYFTIALPSAYLSALGYPSFVGTTLTAEGLPVVGVNLGETLEYVAHSTSYAAYGQMSYRPAQFHDKLKLTGGVRYTADYKSIDQPSTPNAMPLPLGATLAAPPILMGPSRSGKANFNNVSWLGSISYKWTPAIMNYVRISTGYTSGGFDARAGFNPLTGHTYPFTFQPELATSYEAGVKSEFFDRRLRLNGALFYTTYNGLQEDQYAGGEGYVPQVNAHYQGFELELDTIPFHGLTLTGSVGYVDPGYSKFVVFNPATGLTEDIASSAKFQYVPNWTIHTGAEYVFPPTKFGSFSARLDYSYVSRRYYDASSLPFLNPAQAIIADPGQHLLSARIMLDAIPLGNTRAVGEISVFGSNLLNEYLRTSGIDFGSSIGIAGDNYGPPRLFGVELDVKY